jgi:drug/metabolite transporter (DMT)-like permease
MQLTSPNATLISAVALASAAIAILRSPKKLRTTLYVVGGTLLCGVFTTVIGLVLTNPSTAGMLTGLAMQFAMIAVAGEELWRYRKAVPPYPIRK